jgi:hypothetical protein
VRIRALFGLAVPVVIGLATFAPVRVEAEDHFLVIGGGYAPSGNQVSLEKNVIFFRHLLSEVYPDGVSQDVYFADGKGEGRDLQYSPEDLEEPRANYLMAKLYRRSTDFGLKYRDHELKDVGGPSTPGSVARWFREEGAALEGGDRLIIYATAHGGKSTNKAESQNTRLLMWNRQSMSMTEFAKHIDSLKPGVEVVMVMVQCYSGGFSQVVFEGGDAEDGDCGREICGFFATVHDRLASGCTPDVDEADYEDYSSSFWAAMRGRTRMGDELGESADYDGDGVVSFEEAHGYTLLSMDTIDLPTKTSGAFLRARSALRDKKHPKLVGSDVDFGKILEMAGVVDVEVLERLSAQLGLTGGKRVATARREAAQIQEKRKKLLEEGKREGKRLGEFRENLWRTLTGRWPELANSFNAETVRLLTEDADEFVKEVESHPAFMQWEKLGEEIGRISEERFALEKRWVKYQRFIRLVEEVVMAENLREVAGDDAMERYEAICDAERGNLREG